MMARMRAKVLTNTNSLVADWVTNSLLKGLRTAIGDFLRLVSMAYGLCHALQDGMRPHDITAYCSRMTIESSTEKSPKRRAGRDQGRAPTAGLAG